MWSPTCLSQCSSSFLSLLSPYLAYAEANACPTHNGSPPVWLRCSGMHDWPRSRPCCALAWRHSRPCPRSCHASWRPFVNGDHPLMRRSNGGHDSTQERGLRKFYGCSPFFKGLSGSFEGLRKNIRKVDLAIFCTKSSFCHLL